MYAIRSYYVALKDMEFVQYHPTGLPGTGILITEATRGEGGYVINSEGERFLVTRDYGVGTKAELGPRDMISRAIVQEIAAGRGIKGPYGEYVHLDLTHLGEANRITSYNVCYTKLLRVACRFGRAGAWWPLPPAPNQ